MNDFVALYKNGTEPPRYFNSPIDSPSARFAMLKDVAENIADQGCSIMFAGEYEGAVLDRLDLSKIEIFSGASTMRYQSVIRMTCQHDAFETKPAGVAIALGQTTRVESCVLINEPANFQQDGALIGPKSQTDPASNVVSNVKLVGQDWTWYHWPAADCGTTLAMLDCDIHFARTGVVQGGNNGKKSHYMIKRCRFVGNAVNSVSESKLSDRNLGLLAGVVFRAGLCDVLDCDFIHAANIPQTYNKFGVPRVAWITDNYYSRGNRGTVIRESGCRFGPIRPGMATHAYNVDVVYGTFERIPIPNTRLTLDAN